MKPQTTPTPFESSQGADEQMSARVAHLPRSVAWEMREAGKKLIRDAAVLFRFECIHLYEFPLKYL